MTHVRRVAVPALLLSGILVLFPLLELTQSIWPIRPGEIPWRVLSVGLFSRMLVTPLLGLVLAYGAALLLGRRRLLRGLAVLSGLLALILIVGLVFYALDALQLRSRLVEANRNYDVGILLSFAKYGVGLVFLLTLMRSQWRAATAVSREGRGSVVPESMVLRPRMGPAIISNAARRSAARSTNGRQAPGGPGVGEPPDLTTATIDARRPS